MTNRTMATKQPTTVETNTELTFANLWKELRARRTPKARKIEIKRQLLLHYMWIVRYTLYNMTIPFAFAAQRRRFSPRRSAWFERRHRAFRT